jgi:LmbE family N-acetylglucosaminyl deacetylase
LIRSSLARAADRALTGIWGEACWTAGRIRRPVRRWSSSGGRRVVVVAPHPDDEVAGCGGVIALHRDAGDSVAVVHVTDGRRSRAGGLDPETMARARQAEARLSTQVLQVHNWQWLGLPEGEWRDTELTNLMAPLLDALTPDVLYAPSRVDFHPEHYAVARVLASLPAVARVGVVRIYQVHVPLTGVLVNLVAPIANGWARTRHAFDRYTTQQGSLRGPWRLKLYAARTHAVRWGGEEFWELGPSEYAALHAEPPSRPLIETFRGLRLRSLTDPLAFAVGRRERRRLRELTRVR